MGQPRRKGVLSPPETRPAATASSPALTPRLRWRSRCADGTPA